MFKGNRDSLQGKRLWASIRSGGQLIALQTPLILEKEARNPYSRAGYHRYSIVNRSW